MTLHGFKDATTDPDRIATMLAAPGSNGNYGVVPAPGFVIIDVDGEGWREKLRGLGLPKTLAVETANGVHLYFGWPDENGPAPSTLWGWKVRSEAHGGYVVGPGSVHQTGFTYRIAHVNGDDPLTVLYQRTHDLPKSFIPQQQSASTSITVGTGLRMPESVPEGSRHDYLRDRARTLRGGGLTGDALFNAVSALNQRLPQPKTDEEVRRAIGDVESKFGEDPLPVDVTTIPRSVLWADVNTYLAALPIDIEWVSPLAAYGFVSLVAGPPKGGKSTLIANLFHAREANAVFLWGDPVPEGPSALVTEEGGLAVARKVQGLTKLDILDRRAFVGAGLSKLTHLIEVIQLWCNAQEGAALVVIDTLAVWGDIKDENDAMAATQAVAKLALLAQTTGAAIVLIHHARKGGGDHGEAIRGSGAIFAAVDQAIELGFTSDPLSDNRKLAMSGRLIYPDDRELGFDRATNTYSLTTSTYVDPFPIDQFPTQSSGDPGLTSDEAAKVWGVSLSRANEKLKSLTGAKKLVSTPVRDGRVSRNVYHRVVLLDVRSVGERMADIFTAGKESPDA